MQSIMDMIPEIVKGSTFAYSDRIDALEFVYRALEETMPRQKAKEIDTAISRLPLGQKLQLIDGLAVERTKEGLKVIQEQLPEDSSLLGLAEENLRASSDGSSTRSRSVSSSSTDSTSSESEGSSASENLRIKPAFFSGSIFRSFRGETSNAMPPSREKVSVGAQAPLRPIQCNLFSPKGGLEKSKEKLLADEFVAAFNNEKKDSAVLVGILRGTEASLDPADVPLAPNSQDASRYADLLIKESSIPNNQLIGFGNHYQLKINKETGIVTVVDKPDDNSPITSGRDSEEASI